MREIILSHTKVETETQTDLMTSTSLSFPSIYSFIPTIFIYCAEFNKGLGSIQDNACCRQDQDWMPMTDCCIKSIVVGAYEKGCLGKIADPPIPADTSPAGTK